MTTRYDSASPRLVAPSPPNAAYRFVTIPVAGASFLRQLCSRFSFTTFRLWIDASGSPEDSLRTRCGGLVTGIGYRQGRPIAVVWSDFRVKAASFGHANSARLVAFLAEADRGDDEMPLVYFVNSAGISLMEGRTAFSDAFALWPSLLAYAERHLVLTCAMGKCLGLAPLLYGLGHYRVAVAGQTQLNLTGPEVIRLFFGTGVDFEQSAAAERFLESTDLVHELVDSVDAACVRFLSILGLGSPLQAADHPKVGPKTDALLTSFLDHPPLELIPGWCDRVRLFLGTRHGERIGIFLNPPERSNNMITVRTLDKYAAGLDVFRALRLPIVSLLDSPGFDPRVAQSAANNFRRMLAVGGQIIRYPHGMMGVVTGRCFGGSATLGFPKVFGGKRVVALRGSRIGVMDERIVDRLLSGSRRLLAQWREVAARQTPGHEDLLDSGTIDAIVDLKELAAEIDCFLAHNRRPVLQREAAARPDRSTRLRRSRAGRSAPGCPARERAR